MIHYRCPECDTAMESPDSMADTTVPCPSCHSRVDVPEQYPPKSSVHLLSWICFLLGVVAMLASLWFGSSRRGLTEGLFLFGAGLHLFVVATIINLLSRIAQSNHYIAQNLHSRDRT